MVLASVDKITISWPELNSEPIIKAPDWSPEVSAREYALNFQLLVNQKQKKLMNARIMRQHFVLELEKLFKNFLLERDDDEFLFVSLYIMIATDDNILGAAVCNFHLNNYPEFAPKVYLTSPLFFESAVFFMLMFRILSSRLQKRWFLIITQVYLP